MHKWRSAERPPTTPRSLLVLDYLLYQGVDQAISHFQRNLEIVETLEEFQYFDERGNESGSNVRTKAKDITSMLRDEERLHEVRLTRRPQLMIQEDEDALDEYIIHKRDSSQAIKLSEASLLQEQQLRAAEDLAQVCDSGEDGNGSARPLRTSRRQTGTVKNFPLVKRARIQKLSKRRSRRFHILDSQDARHAAQELEGSSAQSFVDAIQNVLDWGTLPDARSRAKARQLMQKVAEAGEQLPSSLFVIGVNDHDEHPTFGAGFGDVYQASYDGKRVALKRIRTFTADSTTHRNRLGLRHRFILPLLGIDRSTFAPSFCMVSPWMKHEIVLEYLRDRGRGDVNRLATARNCTSLDYLHSLNIVHGDLRGTNILISDDANLFTGSPPFAHLPDVAAMLRVIAGDRPEQPSTTSAALWELVTAAWVHESHLRPSIHEITVGLESIPAMTPAPPA
ncbi:kinase-like domain-containing protein [Mycena olivaceomarginata]|nr:kinase-like domain-containing protein [Mycena olivaceomarginata]